MSKKFAIILAGGKGTRLWPLSRENYPKQFVEFLDGESLFQLTIKRLLKYFPKNNILVISSQSYKFHLVNQIENLRNVNKPAKDSLKKNIILEPCPKSTAPAALLALKFLENESTKDDVFFVFPADHIIKPFKRFAAGLDKAYSLAARGNLTIFGIKPKSAHPGYGYVLGGKKIKNGFQVKTFIEKPSPTKLKTLIKKNVYWNAGIFCFKKDVFLQELKKYSPKISKYSKFNYQELFKRFHKIDQDSIDYAVMQKTKKAAIVKFDIEWSDLGSWDSVQEHLSKGSSNFSIGNTEFLESKGCFSFSEDKLVSFLGVKDLLLIESSDSILVVKKGFSNKVKDLTALLNKKKMPHIKDGLTVYRPWGYYTILKEKENYKVKEIGVYPKKYVSLQKHKYRSEHWNVVEGKAKITLGSKTMVVKKNQSIYVPKGEKHRVFNLGDKLLKIIEVQIGTYLGEDDIKRFDKYIAE